MKEIMVPLAPGFEELEAVTIIDLFRRVPEVRVTTASISDNLQVTGSHEITIFADQIFSGDRNLDRVFDLIVLPGGMPGTLNLVNNKELMSIVKDQVESDRLCAAICAAPAFLVENGVIGADRYVTCYPTMKDKIKDKHYLNREVVVDRNLITGRGPGAAIPFVLALLESLCGKGCSDNLSKSLQYASEDSI